MDKSLKYKPIDSQKVIVVTTKFTVRHPVRTHNEKLRRKVEYYQLIQKDGTPKFECDVAEATSHVTTSNHLITTLVVNRTLIVSSKIETEQPIEA